MGGHRSVTVDVYIDDFSDVDIISAARARGYVVVVPKSKVDAAKKRGDYRDMDVLIDKSPSPYEEMESVRDAIRERRVGDALATIDRLLAPKYRNVADCREKYDLLKKAV